MGQKIMKKTIIVKPAVKLTIEICHHKLDQDKYDPEYVRCRKCKKNFQLQQTNVKVTPKRRYRI